MKLFLTEPFATKWHNLDPFKEVLFLMEFNDLVLVNDQVIEYIILVLVVISIIRMS